MRVFGYICAALAALCLGYAITSGMDHVYFTAFLYSVVSYICFAAHKSDRRREEESRKLHRYE